MTQRTENLLGVLALLVTDEMNAQNTVAALAGASRVTPTDIAAPKPARTKRRDTEASIACTPLSGVAFAGKSPVRDRRQYFLRFAPNWVIP